MTGKPDGVKTPILRHKAIQRGQVEVGVVGDGFQSSELDPSCLCSLRHGCSFHVHRNRPIRFAESNLLRLIRNGRGTHQDAVTRADFCSGAVGRVDHRARLKNMPDLQSTIQRSGKAN